MRLKHPSVAHWKVARVETGDAARFSLELRLKTNRVRRGHIQLSAASPTIVLLGRQ